MAVQHTFEPINVKQFLSESDFAKVVHYFESDPVTLDEFPKLFNWTPTTVSMGELIDAPINDESNQNPVDGKRVVNYLKSGTVTNFPFTKVRRFINPVTVGQYPDGRLVIQGGRHRISLYLTVAVLSGIDIESPEFRAIEVPVFLMAADGDFIVADNKSRPVTKTETTIINVKTKADIDPTDPIAILKAVSDKKITISDAFLLLGDIALDEAEANPNVAMPSLVSQLTQDTVGQIFASVGAALKKNGAYKQSAVDGDWVGRAFAALTDMTSSKVETEEGIETVSVYRFTSLNKAVETTMKSGITNIARNTSKVAAVLVGLVKFPKPVAQIDKKKVAAATEVVEAAKAKKAAKAKADEAVKADTVELVEV